MRLPSTRNAFFIHFGISLAIFLALIFVMMRMWYPGALFTIDGGVQGLKILAPIDLVLGPALTLLFYRPWKKSVSFDMSFIAAVQVAALSYGVYNVYQQRPVALVFAEQRFESVSHATSVAANAELKRAGIEPIALDQFTDQRPAVIYARGYTKEGYGDYLASLLNGMPELRERSDRYLPVTEGREQISKQHLALVEMPTSTTTDLESASNFHDGSENGTPIELPARFVQSEYYRIPLKGRYGNGYVVLSQSGFEFSHVTAASKDE